MMRRSDLQPLPEDLILDDVWIPMQLALARQAGGVRRRGRGARRGLRRRPRVPAQGADPRRQLSAVRAHAGAARARSRIRSGSRPSPTRSCACSRPGCCSALAAISLGGVLGAGGAEGLVAGGAGGGPGRVLRGRGDRAAGRKARGRGPHLRRAQRRGDRRPVAPPDRPPARDLVGRPCGPRRPALTRPCSEGRPPARRTKMTSPGGDRRQIGPPEAHLEVRSVRAHGAVEAARETDDQPQHGVMGNGEERRRDDRPGQRGEQARSPRCGPGPPPGDRPDRGRCGS